MKINPVQATSLLAYEKVLQNVGERQLEVLKCLNTFSDVWGNDSDSASNMMLAEKLEWSINCVTPRIFELRQKGLVYEHHMGNCKITNRKAIYWAFRKK